MQKHIYKMIFTLALFALCATGASRFITRPVAGQTSTLHGAAALNQLKQDGQYDSLQAAMQQARLQVSRAAATPLGRAAWHAPNAAAGYDAYVTEAGVSLVVGQAGILSHGQIVSLHLRSLGYGAALHGVAAGEVNGDQQSITIERTLGRGKLHEWFVNTADGLEHGFTLDEPPPSAIRNPQSAIPLRLALAVSKGWQAVADDDGARVSLHNGAGQAVDYGQLVARDARGVNLAARLSVADAQVVLEVEDHDAQYPLTIDPLFTLQQTLTAADGEANDQFGQAVALSGNTAVVGAPEDDVAANNQGSVYVFVRNAAAGQSVWTPQGRLTAPDGALNDNFGAAVALDGDTLAVGAPGDDNGANINQGSVYVFTRSGTVWTQQAKLMAGDGAAGDAFGNALALAGETLAVGAPLDDNGAKLNQGSAYVFTRNGASWTPQPQLSASDGAQNDLFGNALALDGDTLLVGAQGDEAGRGSAYVFARGAAAGGAAWVFQQKLQSNGGAAGDQFGAAVALSGDTALVGAPTAKVETNLGQGAAYVFTRNSATWTQQPPLTAEDGAAFDFFGRAVALSGDLAVVGASGDDIGAQDDQGSAYVFLRSFNNGGANWIQQRKLFATAGRAEDAFGSALALYRDTVLVGALGNNVGANADQGSAQVFVIRDNRYVEQQRVLAADGAAEDTFGITLALSGTTLAVGAWHLQRPGAVYLFTRGGTAANPSWTLQQKLTANDGFPGNLFGGALALDGETLAVGAPYDGSANTKRGAVYLFVRNGTVWTRQAKLPSSTLPASGDYFGNAVALDGDTVAVGAFGTDNNGNPDQGAVYVYARNNQTWSQQALIKASDGAAHDGFGHAVALQGDTLVAGAPGAKVSAHEDQGKLYVYTRSGTNWTFRVILDDLFGAANDYLGAAVALNGNTVVAGAQFADVSAKVDQGAALVWMSADPLWVSWSERKLTAPDGAAGDKFGGSVALEGDTLVIGAAWDTVGGRAHQGSAYVFTRLVIDRGWDFQHQLTASDGGAEDYFGHAVALAGDFVAVAAPLDTVGMNLKQGAVYSFVSPACPVMTITPASLPNGLIGAMYDQPLSVSDPVSGAQWSVSSGTLPPGLTLEATGRLRGTPVAAGTARFTITATNPRSLCPGSRAYTLTITAAACPTITLTPASLPNGTVGVAYSQTLTATGGTAPYTFAVTAGALPGGVALAANGGLSGTPTAAGTFNFTIRATDANGCQGTRAYTVVIAPAACPTITLNPATLPNGTVGVAYSQQLTATGGTAPYTFALTAGVLPPGVSLNTSGALSGTPTAAGPYNFTAQASDANACTGTRNYTLTVNQALTRAKKGDFDGDGKADLTYWRGATSDWVVRRSSDGQLQTTPWGAGYAPYFDVIVPGDYDGDGKQDHAIWRGQDTLWYIRKSSDGQPLVQLWGANYAPYFDVPTPGDFDGDGKTDMAVWRPTDATFYVKRSSNQTNLAVTWGQQGDLPVAADYDGDGKCDFAVWRPSTGEWLIQKSSGGTQTTQWGAGYAPYFDVPVVGDYDGDGKADPAIWRGQDSLWYIRKSSDGQPLTTLWGANYAPYNDVPVPGDYDGDGKTDIAVWRPTDGTWYVKRSSDGTNFVQAHGQNGDTPAPAHGVK